MHGDPARNNPDPNADPRLQLVQASTAARVWLFLLTVGMPMSLAAIVMALAVADGGPMGLIGGSIGRTTVIALGTVTALTLGICLVVDLAERTEYKPMLKLNGTGLPRFKGGWYLLRDRSRAFVATTGGPRVLWIPTSRTHSLLLQPLQPQALLDALRTLADGDPRG